MIHKLLIANRGEVATRVIRTARRLGIGTVAVHTEADARALHVLEADERVAIGGANVFDSYLKVEQMMTAAEQTGADAVHPGYGLLAESPGLVGACLHAGLCFVGPPIAVIETMASKVDARRAARAAGLPVVPGCDELCNIDNAVEAAAQIGYPVLVKPVAGAGGIGMTRADDEASLRNCFDAARRAAGRILGDDDLYLEKLLSRPRQVGVQIAADVHGNVIHLGLRDCSLQRRRQKLMEESPCAGIDAQLAARLTDAAVTLARSLEYRSLGTVEMLVCGDDFYFLEMSTRLQVEHPVTEMVTGLDLVEWQIRTTLGEALPAQEEIDISGHAIQCRIYAEDPEHDFAHAPGRVEKFLVPVGDGIRNDVGVAEGDYVTPFYDPLLAKLVVFDHNRAECIARMREALESYEVEGVMTNIGLHRRIVSDPQFADGALHTGFLAERFGLT